MIKKLKFIFGVGGKIMVATIFILSIIYIFFNVFYHFETMVVSSNIILGKFHYETSVFTINIPLFDWRSEHNRNMDPSFYAICGENGQYTEASIIDFRHASKYIEFRQNKCDKLIKSTQIIDGIELDKYSCREDDNWSEIYIPYKHEYILISNYMNGCESKIDKFFQNVKIKR